MNRTLLIATIVTITVLVAAFDFWTSAELEAIKRNASESMKDFVEKVANQIQELMNEEISSRMVNSGPIRILTKYRPCLSTALSSP